MGRHFGDLAKIRHVITYSISPFEQRAFPSYFSKGIPNVWRRFKTSVFKVAPRKSSMSKNIIYIYIYIYIYIIYSIPAINWSKHCVWLNFSINLHLCLQPWFWCTWPTHGAIVFMNRPKERTLQTEIEQWNRSAEDASICNFLFLFNKENIYVKKWISDLLPINHFDSV